VSLTYVGLSGRRPAGQRFRRQSVCGGGSGKRSACAEGEARGVPTPGIQGVPGTRRDGLASVRPQPRVTDCVSAHWDGEARDCGVLRPCCRRVAGEGRGSRANWRPRGTTLGAPPGQGSQGGHTTRAPSGMIAAAASARRCWPGAPLPGSSGSSAAVLTHPRHPDRARGALALWRLGG
jgi:hypothetical protein